MRMTALHDISIVDGIGYAAAGLVLIAFCMRSMGTLRWVALASNLAFIAYGFLGGIAPVLALHVLLLPVNSVSLVQYYRRERAGIQLPERPQDAADDLIYSA
jgi:hypothetical protein